MSCSVIIVKNYTFTIDQFWLFFFDRCVLFVQLTTVPGLEVWNWNFGIFNVSSISRTDDPIRLLLWFGHHQLHLADLNAAHLWIKNPQNGIYQTDFDTICLVRLLCHTLHVNYLQPVLRSFLYGNKKAKYDENARFYTPSSSRCQTNNCKRNYAQFVCEASLEWQLTYAIRKKLWHWKKPFKKMVKDIYMWNWQLLLGQPNRKNQRWIFFTTLSANQSCFSDLYFSPWLKHVLTLDYKSG